MRRPPSAWRRWAHSERGHPDGENDGGEDEDRACRPLERRSPPSGDPGGHHDGQCLDHLDGTGAEDGHHEHQRRGRAHGRRPPVVPAVRCRQGQRAPDLADALDDQGGTPLLSRRIEGRGFVGTEIDAYKGRSVSAARRAPGGRRTDAGRDPGGRHRLPGHAKVRPDHGAASIRPRETRRGSSTMMGAWDLTEASPASRGQAAQGAEVRRAQSCRRVLRWIVRPRRAQFRRSPCRKARSGRLVRPEAVGPEAEGLVAGDGITPDGAAGHGHRPARSRPACRPSRSLGSWGCPEFAPAGPHSGLLLPSS